MRISLVYTVQLKKGFNYTSTASLFQGKLSLRKLYRYAAHNDVSVINRPHIRRWPRKIIISYHCITPAYNIQYSNMLYRFLA
jgi:hypothetical protein